MAARGPVAPRRRRCATGKAIGEALLMALGGCDRDDRELVERGCWPDQIEAATSVCAGVSVVVSDDGVSTARPLIGADDRSAAHAEREINDFGPVAMSCVLAPAPGANGGGVILPMQAEQGRFRIRTFATPSA